MRLVGVLLLVLGGTVIYLLGIEGLTPDVAIGHVGSLFARQPAAAPGVGSVANPHG